MSLFDVRKVSEWVSAHFAPTAAETFAWLAVILIHAATIPTLAAVLVGLSDSMPTVDMVLLTWAGLCCLFAQAAIQKNMTQILTISLGFVVQASLLALIFFK
jgi:hypothetical protein